jgi:hypothetical protein
MAEAIALDAIAALPMFYMPEIIAGDCLAAAYAALTLDFEHSRRDVQVAFLVAHAFAFHSA